MENTTEVTEFILLGLTNDPDLQVPLFIMFTVIYLITLIGNLGIMLLILLDSRLHTPMYFFLSNLSLVDFCFSSAVTPTVMAGLLLGHKVISYNACAAQMFFFVIFATVEMYLLASMAYDRYAAVCKPLHYTTTMTTGVCLCLAVGSYVCGFLNASIHIGNTFSLSFCEFNVVHHFFCDIPAVMVLSCSDRHVSELVLIYVASFHIFFILLVILISYIFIFITILKMHSNSGYQKALSTCASHFTAVFIFYGTVIFMYLRPSSSRSMDTDKIASVFYTMVIPMLNPLVYSLRNKEVKSALMKVILEREEENREKHPNQGLDVQPKYVSWQKLEPASFWCEGRHSNLLSGLAMALWVVLHGPHESSPIECLLVHFSICLPQLELRLYESSGFISFVNNMIHSS